jgi:hypothetical protein
MEELFQLGSTRKNLGVWTRNDVILMVYPGERFDGLFIMENGTLSECILDSTKPPSRECGSPCALHSQRCYCNISWIVTDPVLRQICFPSPLRINTPAELVVTAQHFNLLPFDRRSFDLSASGDLREGGRVGVD